MGYKVFVLALVLFATLHLASCRLRLTPGRMNYFQAERACRAMGGRLAWLRTARQYRAARRFLGRRHRYIWVGASDRKKEGRWRWGNSRYGVSRRLWNRRQPNNRGNEDCAVIVRNGKLNDTKCRLRVRALCQVRKVRCKKSRTIRGKCRRGLRPVKHIYYSVRGGRCRRKVYVKRVRCRGRHGKFCRCSAVGDPHYRTFDGNLIHFYGVCKYTLSKSIGAGGCSFNIEVKNERRGRNRRVSYTRYVEIKMAGVKVRLGQRRRAFVNNRIVGMPFRTKGVRLFYSGRTVQFVHSRCGVRVAFDGRSNAYLQVSGRYRGKMTGICGDCNGNRADDMRTKSGKRVSGRGRYNKIGDSYAVLDDSKGPKRCRRKKKTPMPPKKWCVGRMAGLVKSSKFCGAFLSAKGPFARCIKVAKINVRNLYTSCKIDVCANAHDARQRHRSKCQAFKALEERCNEKGITGINWRGKLGCPLHCGTNKEYSSNMNPCPKTCENHFLGTKALCFKLPKRSGCQCKPGYILDGALCRKPKNCKCLELCIDRAGAAKCRLWKRQGKCARFPRYMRLKCGLTCGLCKPPKPICEDHISTSRCMKFRRQGKCRFAFYRQICGLSCNLKRCPCRKGKVTKGPCLKNKTQVVTIVVYKRSRRSHTCVRRRRVVRRRCGVCKTIYRVRRGKCNLCTRRRLIVTVHQSRRGLRCVRRVRRISRLCRGCPRRFRKYSRCVSNAVRVIVSTFMVRKGCFKCVRRTIKRRLAINCGRPSRKMTGCNRVTNRKYITVIRPFARRCRCYRRVKRTWFICRCPKPKVGKFCRGGVKYTVYTRFRKTRYHCKIVRRVKKVRVRCARPRIVRGGCNRRRCYALDSYVRYYVTGRCGCRRVIRRKARRCCCRKGYNRKFCIRSAGIIVNRKVRFTLRYNRRARRHVCIRSVRDRRRRMGCGKRVRVLRRTACRRPRCVKATVLLYSWRVGCKCHRRKVVRRSICCCRRIPTRVRCVGNNRLVQVRRYKVLIRGRCVSRTIRRVIRIVKCKNVVRRFRCNRRTRRKVTLITLVRPRNCRCRAVRTYRKSKLCLCRPKRRVMGRCNRRSCRQLLTIVTRRGPIRGRCYTSVRRYNLRCCCRGGGVYKRCNRRTGNREIITVRKIFVRRTRTCITRRYTRRILTACPRKYKRVLACRTVGRYGIQKVVYRYVWRIRSRCSCRTRIVVRRRICRCPRPVRLPTICVRGTITFRVRVYRKRGARCITYIKRRRRRVPCSRKPRVVRGRCSRGCRRVDTYFYNVRAGCRCLRRKRRYSRVCCCRKNSKTKRCIRNRFIVTYLYYSVLNKRYNRCYRRVRVLRSVRATCRKRVRVVNSRCRRCRFTRTRLYYAVRACRCRLVRRLRRVYRCCCPRATVRKSCVRNMKVTIKVKYLLVRGRCIRRITRKAVGTPCPRVRPAVTPCRRGSRYMQIKYVYFYPYNCRCRKRVRVVRRPCRCRGPRIVRSGCRRNKRKVYRVVFRLRGKRAVCKAYRRLIAYETCRCPRVKRIAKCVGLGTRVTLVYSRRVYVNRKGVRVARCNRFVRNLFYRKRCPGARYYYVPCNKRRRFRSYRMRISYKVRACKCIRRVAVVSVKACGCARKNSSKNFCYRGKYRRYVYKYWRAVGAACKLYVRAYNRPIRCTRRVYTRLIRRCNLKRGASIYHVYQKTRYFVRACRCVPSRRNVRVLCRCIRNRYLKRCIAGRRYRIRIYYVRRRNRCVKIVRRTIFPVVCRGRVIVRRGRCVKKGCRRLVKIYYISRSGCRCVRRVIGRFQKCCCPIPMGPGTGGKRPRPGTGGKRPRPGTGGKRPRPGTGGKRPRPGTGGKKPPRGVRVPRGYVYRGCVRGYVVFSRTRLVLRNGRRFLVRLGRRYFIRHKVCRRKTTVMKRRVICRKRPIFRRYCNRRTGVGRSVYSYTVRIRCHCIRKTRMRRYRCVSCRPLRVVRRGPCPKRGFFRKITVKTRRLRGLRCIWKTKVYRRRCRCRRGSTKTKCNGRGSKVIRQVIIQLRGNRCRVIIRRRVYPIRCGRGSRERVFVGKCKRNKRRILFVRVILNKRTCRCIRQTRKIVVRCRCPRPGIARRRCLNNRIKQSLYVRYVRRRYRCIRLQRIINRRIGCPRGVRRVLKKRCVKGKRVGLVYVYKAIKCKCRKVILRRIVSACKCYKGRVTVKHCLKNSVRRYVTTYAIRRGLRCIAKTIVRNYPIRCPGRRVYATRCSRKTCKRAIITKVRRAINCKCKWVTVRRVPRTCCCLQKPSVRRYCSRNIRVYAKTYYVFYRGRCYRRVYRRNRRVGCPRIIRRRKRCGKACNGVILTYAYRVNKCKCKLRVIRRRRIKCCCPKPKRGASCNRRNGVFVRYVVYYIKSRGRCYRRIKRRYRRTRCVGAVVRASKCTKRTKVRVVKVYVRRRRGCGCYWRLVSRRREPCRCPKRAIVKKSRCIGVFRYISVYRKVLRARGRRRYCATVLIRRFRERCRCPKPMKRHYCIRNFRKVTVVVTYRLTRKSPKRCVKKVKKTEKPMGGCRPRPKVVKVRYGRCNKRTRYRRIVKIYKVARGCKCRRFSRVGRVLCACPKTVKYLRCLRGSVKMRTVVFYQKVRRGRRVVCIRRVSRRRWNIRCILGRRNKVGRCYRPGRGLKRRVILTYLYYRRSCRCYKRLIRKRVVPCQCRRPITRIYCRGAYKYVRVTIYRLLKYRCIPKVIGERRRIRCKVGRFNKRSKCRGNSYTVTNILRYIRGCKCIRRTRRRRCNCRCPRTRSFRRCSGRYYFTITTIFSRMVGCRCKKYRRYRNVYPKCSGRPGVTTSRCKRNRATSYVVRTYRRRFYNRRRCICGVKTTKRRLICYCKPKVRVSRRCVRNRYTYVIRTKRYPDRRTNRCRRGVFGRRTLVTRCRGARNVYKCNKRNGNLYQVRTRYYPRNCRCRKVTRVYKLGKCKCDVRRRKITDRCIRRNCVRVRRFSYQRLVGRRCLKYYINKYTKCCCPKRPVRRWCDVARGLKRAVRTIFRLVRGRCLVRYKHSYRRVVCRGGRRTKSRCIGIYKYVTTQIHRRVGCKCAWRNYRRVVLRCRCNKARVYRSCNRAARVHVTRRYWWVLKKGRCYARNKTIVRKIPCSRRPTIRYTKCNRRTGKNYRVYTRFYVGPRCKCRALVYKTRKDCLCRPKKRVYRRCNPANGITYTTIVYRKLNKRVRLCYNVVKRRSRRTTCRPSRWRRVRTKARCAPVRPYGLTVRVYKRRVRRGCRCVTQKMRQRCHCRCTGPRLIKRCVGGGRYIIIDRYTYRYNGCRCRRIRRRSTRRIYCRRRNRVIVGRCVRCRQNVARYYYFVKRCRCRRRVRRSRRVCCCKRGKTTKRCLRRRGLIVIRKVINRFVPYRCLRTVRKRYIRVRCRTRPVRSRPSRCSRRKYSVTITRQVRRGCRCVRVTKRVRLPCPCRKARFVNAGCNRRTCRQRRIFIYFVLRKFRCIRYTRNYYRRCCCHRRLKVRNICRGNRRYRVVSWIVFVRRTRTCMRRLKKTDTTPRCGKPYTARRYCNRRTGRLVIIRRWRFRSACKCRTRVKRTVGRCRCPRKRVVRSCYRGKYILKRKIYYQLIRNRCYKRTKQRYVRVICRKRINRVYRCNRYSCIQTAVSYFWFVRACRCRVRKLVTRRRCCCRVRRSKVYVKCIRGRRVRYVIRYYFDAKRRVCVKKVTKKVVVIRCRRRVWRKAGRCYLRRAGRRYQLLTLVSFRRLACKCIKVVRRRWRLCRCRRSKKYRRCVGGTIKVFRSGEKLVLRRGARYCRRSLKVVKTVMIRCKRGVSYIRRRCYRGRRVFFRVTYKRVGCRCHRIVRKGSVLCGCRRGGSKSVRCFRRTRITTIIRYYKLCPRTRLGWMRCRCYRRVFVSKKRIICRRPRYSVSRCVRGKRSVKVTVFRNYKCKCIVKRRKWTIGCRKKCNNAVGKRACIKFVRRGLCKTNRNIRKVCRKMCGLCKPCKNIRGVKKMRYVKVPNTGLKTDKRYKKKFVLTTRVVRNNKRGIKRCKKMCNRMKLCQSFETVPLRRRRPSGGRRPKPSGGRKPKPSGGRKPKPSGGRKPKPGKGRKPKPSGGRRPKPGKGRKPKPGKGRKPKPGKGRKPKYCKCVFNTITRKTFKKIFPRKRIPRSPGRTYYSKRCVKPCKKSSRVVRFYKCRCIKSKVKLCFRVVVIATTKRDKKLRCKKTRRTVKVPCRMPCINLKSKKYCRRVTRRGGCRKRAVRRVCNKSCMPKCRRCGGKRTLYGRCVKVGGKYYTYRYTVYRRKRRGICVMFVRGVRVRCTAPCKRSAFTRVNVGRCRGGKRSVSRLSLRRYRNKRGVLKCKIRVTRRVYNCRGCCPSVLYHISPCRGGRRFVRVTYWARVRNCCRRRVVVNRYLCNRCPRDSVRYGRCRFGRRLVYRVWYHRSNVAKSRCSRHVKVHLSYCRIGR